jgi:hypothetical protein
MDEPSFNERLAVLECGQCTPDNIAKSNIFFVKPGVEALSIPYGAGRYEIRRGWSGVLPEHHTHPSIPGQKLIVVWGQPLTNPEISG